MKNLMYAAALLIATIGCKSQQPEIVNTPKPEVKSADRAERGARGQRVSIDEIFKMDVNADGFLSKAELADRDRLVERFDTIDTNSDGLISRTEFENAPRPERRGRRQNQ